MTDADCDAADDCAKPDSGARIIAFPGRDPGRAPGRAVPSGQERLDRALVALLRATQEQASAVAAWRRSLAELDRTMVALAGSVGRYQVALSETAVRVDELGAQARRLEASIG